MDEKLLKEALHKVMEQDVEAIEDAMKNTPEHVFSNAFENEMEALIRKSSKNYITIRKRTVRKASMIAVVAIMLFACVGFSPIGKAVWDYCAKVFQRETFGNISMGLGRAAYDGENVYYLANDVVYSYNVNSKELEEFQLQDETPVRTSMFVQDEFIYYGSVGENSGLKRISKDGVTVEQVMDYENGFQQIFLDEKNAYILESIEGSLVVKDLQTGEEKELFSSVLSYFVDEDKVYVIARENNTPYLFVADKATLQFSKQDLSFVPIAIYVDDNELYLAQQGDYQIIKISDREEEKLPIFGTYYQVIDGKIIYLDSTIYFDSCFDLVSYDLKSGQSEIICENVFDFAVLDADYIYIQCDTIPNSEFYLYDYKELLNIKK